MPDFRPLFFIAKILTCCCYPRKSSKSEAQNQPHQVEPVPRRNREASSDYSQRSGMSQSPGVLHYPDVSADVQVHDDAGANSDAPGSLKNHGSNFK
ncbi:hypothetical protein HG530_005400 [Fusarium avenaceum]|nr:hypothetical protein HG530_005400 [Fusarium avenaceum]